MRYPNYVSLLIILLYMVGCDDEKGSICSTPDQPRFSLQDLNPLSESFGETISPEFFLGKVTLYYFPFSET